jgi:hypothetical protein
MSEKKAGALDERLVIWLAASRDVWCMYSDWAMEHGMMRVAAILLVLGLAVVIAGCSKCGGLFGSPGACHSDAPAVR